VVIFVWNKSHMRSSDWLCVEGLLNGAAQPAHRDQSPIYTANKSQTVPWTRLVGPRRLACCAPVRRPFAPWWAHCATPALAGLVLSMVQCVMCGLDMIPVASLAPWQHFVGLKKF
jgi:hypothetical protein